MSSSEKECKNRMIRKAISVFLLLLLPACFAETFLVTSDLHLTVNRVNREATLEALTKAQCDALILLGDSTNNAHTEEHNHVLEYLESLESPESLEAPAYIIPGNHDVTLDRSFFPAKYHAYGWDQAFAKDAASASYAVMTRDICFLMLDTNDVSGGYVASLGGISSETCDWIDSTLRALPEGVMTVACGHHPILPIEREKRTPGAARLADTLRGNGVKLYLCGHDHCFAAAKVDGLQQITIGQAQAYPGWAGTLEVTPEGIYWHVVELFDAATKQMMKSATIEMGRRMAQGTLAGTVYKDDKECIDWFVETFEKWLSSELNPKMCSEMLKAPVANKWRQVETQTVVKDWMFGLLENCPQDFRDIYIHRDQTL